MKIELISPNDVIYMTKESQKELIRSHYNNYRNSIFDGLNYTLKRWSPGENLKEYNIHLVPYQVKTYDMSRTDEHILIELISDDLVSKGWKTDYKINSINRAELKIYRPDYKPWYKKLFK